MDFVRQALAAAVLVALSLWIQCAGMAALINWGLAYFARETHQLSLFHSTLLIVRVTSLMIGLHIAQILVWAAFYRWMFSLLGIRFLLLDCQLFHGRLR